MQCISTIKVYSQKLGKTYKDKLYSNLTSENIFFQTGKKHETLSE